MPLSGPVNIPRLWRATARARNLPLWKSWDSSLVSRTSAQVTCHLKREQFPSGGDQEVTICTVSSLQKATPEIKSVLPSDVLSTAGMLSPCHKVKVPPPPKTFFTLQKTLVFPPAPSQQLSPAKRLTFRGLVSDRHTEDAQGGSVCHCP